MKQIAMLLGLILGVGLLAVAQQCPPLGLPVTRVDPLDAGGYLIWIQNNAKCPYNEFRIVFHVDITSLKAVAINGTEVATIRGEGSVWIVTLKDKGLNPNGFLLLSIAGVNPPVSATCAALVRAVFPAPLCK
ncbi:MAG: hypothetical protein N2320_00765 [Candidatus Bipolaricaulota bacterium]|nr:hypothetical protein [Candidatus Bipolaricaulota bacterium]